MKGRVAFLSLLSLFGGFAPANTQAVEMPSSATAANSDIMKLRDPFKRPALNRNTIPRTELEMVPLQQLKILGVVTGPFRLRAMIATPNGKTHFVGEGAKLGTRQGVIIKISPNSVQVREKSVNVIGEEENVVTEILLPGDRTAQVD